MQYVLIALFMALLILGGWKMVIITIACTLMAYVVMAATAALFCD